MNARTNSLHLTVECRQVRDAVCGAFHTILLHRSFGKFNYTSDSNYNLGSIGVEEFDCEHIDLTYIRVNSPALISDVDTKVQEFSDTLQNILYDGLSPSGISHQSSHQSFEDKHRWESLLSAQ